MYSRSSNRSQERGRATNCVFKTGSTDFGIDMNSRKSTLRFWTVCKKYTCFRIAQSIRNPFPNTLAGLKFYKSLNYVSPRTVIAANTTQHVVLIPCSFLKCVTRNAWPMPDWPDRHIPRHFLVNLSKTIQYVATKAILCKCKIQFLFLGFNRESRKSRKLVLLQYWSVWPLGKVPREFGNPLPSEIYCGSILS